MSAGENNITRVLFVCLGNICRSPMAEAVFCAEIKKLQLSGKFEVDSAGTAAYHVTLKDFERFDHILCMDMSNLSDLKDMKPKGSKAKVALFGSYDPEGQRIINDPYYGGKSGFETNYHQIVRSSFGFLKHLGYN
ncbi:Low molecular weight phosphotyrosine protein phosphatase [Mycoemilia scoparia]|uniref:protein-tyrosine-phosphatase n=1 Tax=Mycoemilia scoparia TaxID=417184 RepID=A0A9W8DMG1_9FUNG|nr:Low molecular weight phosphotyrosine protein phosphatase [Mycoemilia scoparia]